MTARPDDLRRPVLAVAAVAFVAALLFLPAHALRWSRTGADEPQYLLTALSIAEDGDLDIADELRATRWREFHEAALPRQTERRADGTELSPHDPGLPVLLAVPMALGGWAAAKGVLAATAGVLAALSLWTSVRRFDVDRRIAVPAVLALSVAPPFAVYGAQIYPELPAAVCVAGIVALAGATRRRTAAIVGVIVVATVAAWLSVKYVPVVGVVAAVALWVQWRADQRRAVGWALLGGSVLGLLYAVAHVRWYGGLTAYASGDFFAANGGQLSVMGDRPDRLARTERLAGLLVDRNFGLAAWQPAWLLIVPAVAALAVWRPRQWVLLAAPLTVGWAVATWVAVTMHGWWWPGRHVVHALPLAVVVIAWWLAQVRLGRAVAWSALGVGAVSTVWVAAEASFADLTLVFDPWSTTNPVHRLMRPLLPDLRTDGLGDHVLLAAWVVAAAVAVLGGHSKAKQIAASSARSTASKTAAAWPSDV